MAFEGLRCCAASSRVHHLVSLLNVHAASLMRDQHRHGHTFEHRSRTPTKRELARPAMPVGAHNNEIAVQIGRARQEDVSDGDDLGQSNRWFHDKPGSASKLH